MAPALTLPSSDGEKLRLSALRDGVVVLYFYPKDNTPGCTVEAKEFSALADDFAKLGARALGVSPDSLESHRKFFDKQGLRVTLLSDVDHKIAEKYGVWVEKNLYGRKYWGVQRATFLIGADGRIARVWPRVKPKGHAQEVLDAVRGI